MSITENNKNLTEEWIEVVGLIALSVCGDMGIQIWIGTVAPNTTSIGHPIKETGFSMDLFDSTDRIWIRADRGFAIVCITRKV